MEKIVEHGDWCHVTHRQLLLGEYAKGGFGAAPPPTQIIGSIEARVNHGRWVAECPEPLCGFAVVADATAPLLLCGQCGKGWYTVVFPLEKTAIEVLLLRRPRVAGRPSTRNWLPGETVAMLALENARRGID